MIHVREALSDHLGADGDLSDLVGEKIFHQQAPQGTKHPFVILHQQTGAPRWTFGGEPVESKLWTVKAVALTSDEAEAVATAIDECLDGAMLPGTQTLDVRRESDVNYAEPGDGVTYRHLGGLYRIWLAP